MRILTSEAATYSFELEGDAQGSEGAAAHFEGRLVVLGGAEAIHSELTMSGDRDGSGSVDVDGGDSEILLIIAAVPEHFTGNQSFGYSVRIAKN